MLDSAEDRNTVSLLWCFIWVFFFHLDVNDVTPLFVFTTGVWFCSIQHHSTN